MNFKRFYFLVLLITATCSAALAQTDTVSVKTIVAKAAAYNSNHPVEKVYLHLDKPYYALGDTIWFKAYLTMDIHQPSTISKVVYIDMINGRDSLVQSLKLPVIGSTAFGAIGLLAPLYKQGNYHIRAYTRWMRNSDPAYFFNKTITIGTLVDKDVLTEFSVSGSVKSSVAKVDATIHYSTQDGRAYANRKVSWKVQNNNEDEVIAKGKGVTDGTGHLVVSFTSNKPGALGKAQLYTAIDLDSKTANNSFSLRHATSQTDIQFFPEGGYLVDGVRSKVAFKAIKPDGLGTDIKGTITDNSGATVATITSQHLGMGVFEILPQAGKTYKAAITFADGSQNTYDLPQAKTDGVVLSTTDTDPYRIGIKISAADGFYQSNKGKPLSLIAQNGQIICFAAQPTIISQVTNAAIVKTRFPTGVIKFTLFAGNGTPLAERVAFLNNKDQLNINANTAKQTYGTRQKVTVNLSAKSIDQKPSQANLSVTVIDEKTVPFDENAETTILSSLLLTSDLKGYIEKPNYYFNHPGDKTNADLDVLMLTQGYTRFLYTDILAGNITENKFAPEDGIDVSGTLRTANGMPVNKGSVTLVIKDRYISKSTLTNSSGEFKFSKLYIPDSLQASVNARGNYNSNSMMILLNNDSYQDVTPNTTAPDAITNIDTALTAYLKNNKQQIVNSHVLKEVVIKSTTVERKPSHNDYPELMGLSPNADQVITADRMEGCVSVYECLKGVALSLMYDNDNLYVRRDYNMGNKNPVQVYYNQMPVDYNYLVNLTPDEIESVEVFLTDGVSGINKMTNTNGVLVVNGKKTVKVKMSQDQIKDALASTMNANVSFVPKGYSAERAFYSPRYDVSQTAAMGGDLRTTLFWSPKVITDKDGNASFDYFNSDGKGSYRVIIEGIDADGNVGRTVYRYKVE
jgi:hypothetical protein